MGSFLLSLAALVHRPKRCASDDAVVDEKSRFRLRFWRLKRRKAHPPDPEGIAATSSAETPTLAQDDFQPRPGANPGEAAKAEQGLGSNPGEAAKQQEVVKEAKRTGSRRLALSRLSPKQKQRLRQGGPRRQTWASRTISTPSPSLQPIRPNVRLPHEDPADFAANNARACTLERPLSEGDLRSRFISGFYDHNKFDGTNVETISELDLLNAKPKRAFDLIGGLSDKEIERQNKRYCVSLRSLRTDEATTEPTQQSEKLRFTCPYLKFDPKTYEERNCRSKAWLGKEIHRLKDHLYKEHRQKPHCHRCGEMFDEESQVTDHLMRPICCNLKPGFKVEGFSRKQESAIRDRKMMRGNTPEAKWTAIFGILFPGVDVPDPYYRTITQAPSDNDRLAPSSSVKIENVFTGAIPAKLEKTTRSKLEAISGPLNENQWREMLDVFKDFTAEGLRHLESHESREVLTVHFGPDTHPTTESMGENDTVLDVPDIVEAPGMDKAAEAQVNSGDSAMPLDFSCGPLSTTTSENTQLMSFSNRDGIYESDPQLAENGSSQDQDWGWMGVSDGCGDIFSSIPVSDVPIETNLDIQEGSVVFLYDQAFEGLEFLYNDWAAESAK